MAAKPRTNDAAANYWADGILSTTPTPYLHVNSVHCEGDAIYSFGHHFPMALIERAPSGRVKRVILNADNYPHRGFANTSGDQGNVKRAVMERVSKVKRNIPVLTVPLTAYGYAQAGIQIRPNPNDPEPEAYSSIRVPVPFHAYNPGPEPVKPAAGCIAGREEEYSYATETYIHLGPNGEPMYAGRLLPGDWIVGRGRNHIIVERWANGVLRWTEERTWGSSTSETKQCPHCRAFDELHAKWSEGMHGGHRREPGVVFGNPTTVYRRTRGYAEFRKYMDEFGDMDAWRAARKADVKRVREARKARAEWVERNFMPLLSYVPKVSRYSKVPKLDPDGFVYPSHAKAYLVKKRELARAKAAEDKRQAEAAKRSRTLRRTWNKRYGLRGIEQEVADWCIEYGLEPNDDNTITVVKAVNPDYRSNHGHPYEVGTGVVSYDWSPHAHCGNGLHFGPTREIALGYHGRHNPVRYLECRVPLANLTVLGDKCKSRYAMVMQEIA